MVWSLLVREGNDWKYTNNSSYSFSSDGQPKHLNSRADSIFICKRTNTSTYHIINVFEDVGQAIDNQGKLVFGDVDQTFLVVLCADFGVSGLLSCLNRKLKLNIQKTDA